MICGPSELFVFSRSKTIRVNGKKLKWTIKLDEILRQGDVGSKKSDGLLAAWIYLRVLSGSKDVTRNAPFEEGT